MRNKTLFVFILALVTSSLYAQDINLPDLKGFKKTTSYPVYTSENLWDYIDGAADTYLSYGFMDLHVAEYKKGKNVIKLEIYRQGSNTMAFGIYSTERSPSFRFLNLGSQGYVAGGATNFFKGSFYVKIRTYSKNENILNSVQSLALKVADMLPGGTEMPQAISLFPASGEKINEETYINESVLGHKFLSKAFKANYERDNDKFSVFVMENISPEDARKTIETYLSATGTQELDPNTNKYLIKDGYNGTIFLAWKENRIVLISGLSIDQSDIADMYISDILK
jgi:hypothetical protein